MNKLLLLAILLLTNTNIFSQLDTVSYSIGVIVAQNLEKQGISGVDADQLAAGLSDVLNQQDLKISVEDADLIFSKYIEEMNEKKYAANKEAGDQFLAENGKRDGVVTTESGLQYEVMTQGEGENATINDSVTVHYHGTLISGEMFDSSVERGQPATFPLGNVIVGWQEGLQLMNVGSKYKIFLPYHLAYGERGAGKKIGPYAALVFEVELLGIN